MIARTGIALVAACAICHHVLADAKKVEQDRFQGAWQVVELVENGKVIPRESIREWLPSGGRLEVIEDAIVFTSPHDGKKHVKTVSIDAAVYPRTIDISSQGKKDGWGIYRFDEGRLVICLSDPDESERPGEFAAREGSKRTLMVLERSADSKTAAAKPERAAPPKHEEPGTTARVLSDAEVTDMLKGSWRYTDQAGALFVIFNMDGTFSTVREMQEIRLFQKVFVQTPVSSGKWQVQNGELMFQVTSSIHPERVGKQFPFTIRSISKRDLIFVDYLGRLSQATKVR